MDLNQNLSIKIANELKVNPPQILATIKLLDEGATVPFIARYRKEVTGSLDDEQLHIINERLTYLRELNDRREVILDSIESQGKLTEKLKDEILKADDKARLEDLYLPYKPKRRTKAQIAIEAGLEPLADSLFENLQLEPLTEAAKYLNPDKEIKTPEDALAGAKQIIMEKIAQDADLIAKLREFVFNHGAITTKLIEDKADAASKFNDYFEYSEAVNKIPSHRMLAVLRGQKEGFLRLAIQLEESKDAEAVQIIENYFNLKLSNQPAAQFIKGCTDWAWKIKLKLKIELDLISKLRESAEADAIKVFQDNLKNLLMQAPAGSKVVLGLDPGFRTGVKVVVVDTTGKLLEHTTIYPHKPQSKWDQAISILNVLCQKHTVDLISIGNGTASRETDLLVSDLIKLHKLDVNKIVISEAGASVYSASKLAAKEFPDLDVSIRGAVSIARRLQDPLAELVKIDPKAIGVGQYQHDVNQIKLAKGLDNVLSDCVNSVGANVNTASIPLLKSIAGLNETQATNIVKFRDENGKIKNRNDLKKVPRLGEKTFEQAAGFLRIIDGDNPLDKSAVHPESYPIVEAILASLKIDLSSLIGNHQVLDKINPNDFVTENFGLPTVKDIIEELKKPGRDPRPEFKFAKFQDDVHEIADLKPDMILEGSVTNVTNFGAFVDIGVHQDGLVHVSELSNKFVKDPFAIVKVGQIVKVKVLDIDQKRKRISLSMNINKSANQNSAAVDSKANNKNSNFKSKSRVVERETSLFADALKKAFNN